VSPSSFLAQNIDPLQPSLQSQLSILQTVKPSLLLPRLLDALLAGVKWSFATFGLLGQFLAGFGIGGHLGLVRCVNFVVFFPFFLRLLVIPTSA
jgi:hypothetical protein